MSPEGVIAAMTKQAILIQLLCVPVAVGLIACHPPEPAGRDLAIASSLNEAIPQTLEIPTGSTVKATGDALAFLKTAESTGLVTISRPSWLPGYLVQVVATPKLLNVAIDPKSAYTAKDAAEDLGGEAGIIPEPDRVRVKVNETKLGEILTDEEYKGELATVGEKHRVILGTCRTVPTAAAAIIGHDLAPQEESVMRFRCIVKYSEFNKKWSVVALDTGSIDPERWYTSHVR
jgi:hypothetical protein